LDLDLLFENARRGDTAARDELFLHLRERFKLVLHHRIWNRSDAEDILQDALVNVELKYRELEIEKSFAAWAHRVLINQINQYYRRKGIKDSRLVHLDGEAGEYAMSTTMLELERRLVDCLRKLHSVNRRHARVINLHYQGYTTDEICGKLNFSRGNLYLLLYRARAMLKRCLDNGEAKP